MNAPVKLPAEDEVIRAVDALRRLPNATAIDSPGATGARVPASASGEPPLRIFFDDARRLHVEDDEGQPQIEKMDTVRRFLADEGVALAEEESAGFVVVEESESRGDENADVVLGITAGIDDAADGLPSLETALTMVSGLGSSGEDGDVRPLQDSVPPWRRTRQSGFSSRRSL